MFYRQTFGAIAITGTLLAPWCAHAFFPFITDDTGTQGSGTNQVELIYEHSREHNGVFDLDDRVIGTESSVSNVVPASWAYGVSDNLDVFAGVARQLNQPRGWLNTEVGLKWVFWGDQTRGWSAAIKPALLIPVSSAMQARGLGNARTNAAVALVGSYMAPSHELHLNVAYTGNRSSEPMSEESERRNLWRVSVAPIYVINDDWKAGFDLGLQTNPTQASRYQAVASIGVQYAATDSLQLGVGLIGTAPINANEKSWGYALTTGLTYQF
jgi:hypothetical protein